MSRAGDGSYADAVQLDRVLDVVERALGDRVVSAVLYGSAAAGGLRRDSDLDVLVVVPTALAADEARALVDGLLPISGRWATVVPGRPVELTVVALDDVVPWRFPPRRQLQYGEWVRDAVVDGTIEPPTDDPDLAILLAQASGAHRLLRGRRLAEVLDPVPAADVRRGIRASLPALLGDLVGDDRNVLLTLARMWATLESGEFLAKDVAAEWAIERLSVSGEGSAAEAAEALRIARAGYLGEVDDRWEDRRDLAATAAAALAARVRG
ncbi:aminoglycoside adenylyltransferase family protein [Agromyces bauzanensis]